MPKSTTGLRFAALLATAGVSLLSTSAQAWDGTKAGRITQIETTCCMNFDFRIHFDGQPLCGPGTADWAFMNTNNGNYQAMTSLLLSSWFSNRPVSLYLTRIAGDYCEVGFAVTGGQ